MCEHSGHCTLKDVIINQKNHRNRPQNSRFRLLVNKLSVFNHKSFLFEWFLTNCALDVLRWVDLLVGLLVPIEISFAAQKFSTNSTDEFLSRP